MFSIETGKRRGSGTTAEVFIELVGMEAKTERLPIPGNFSTASIVDAVLKLDKKLGKLLHIVVGHDNCGDQGVGWFLDKIRIRDSLQPKEQQFSVNTWLGRVDFGDGKELPSFIKVAEHIELTKRSSVSFQRVFNIDAGVFALPSPSKIKKGIKGAVKSSFGYAGEDAYSITRYMSTETSSTFLVCAVADGVSAWNLEGVDAGDFSRSLVTNVQNRALEAFPDAEIDSAAKELLKPTNLLKASADDLLEAKTKGSCTCCVCTLDEATGLLSVANIGDSGICVLRRGVVIFKSEEQEHSFGYPFQLPFDSATESVEYSLQLFEGDIVILGSDGIFDNIYEHEIEGIIRDTVKFKTPDTSVVHVQRRDPKLSSITIPRIIAQAIASKAFNNSLDKGITTPYSYGASEAFNMIYSGGKQDDITCIVIIVTSN